MYVSRVAYTILIVLNVTLKIIALNAFLKNTRKMVNVIFALISIQIAINAIVKNALNVLEINII